MKVLMCHPISWKVNFRPLGIRSRPERAWRRFAELGMDTRFSAPSNPRLPERSARAPGIRGAEGCLRGRATTAAQPFRFLSPGTGLKISRLSEIQKTKASHSFSRMRFGGGAICPGTRKEAWGLPSASLGASPPYAKTPGFPKTCAKCTWWGQHLQRPLTAC